MNGLEKFDIKKRNEIAREARGKRKERDAANKEAKTFKGKLKDAFGLSGGSSESKEKAEKLQIEAQRILDEGEGTLKEREEEKNYRDALSSVSALSEIFLKFQQTDIDNINRDRKVKDIFSCVLQKEKILEGSLNDEKRRGVTLSSLNFLSGGLSRSEESERENIVGIRRFFLDFVGRNRNQIESAIESSSSSDYVEGVKAIFNFIEFGNEAEKKEGIQILDKHAEIAAGRLLAYDKGVYFSGNSKETDLSEELLRKLLLYGSKEEQEKAEEALEKLINSENEFGFASGIHLVSSVYYGEDTRREANRNEMREVKIREVAGRFLWKAVAQYGLSLADSVYVWERYEGRFVPTAVTSELMMVRRLEKKRPGIAGFLMKEFGIKDFDRYPEELLVRQCDEFNNTKKPYGVVLYPRSDSDSAFLEDKGSFLNLFKQIGDKYSIRVAECESNIDVVKRLIKFNQLYGAEHKISFAILGGHGMPSSLGLRAHIGKFSDINLSNIEGVGMQRLKEFFKPNPEIVLLSCSTGADEGLAQTMSEVFGAKVIAHARPFERASFDGKIDENSQLALDVEFSDSEEPSTKRVYFQGSQEKSSK